MLRFLIDRMFNGLCLFDLYKKRIHAGQRLKYILNTWIILGSVMDQGGALQFQSRQAKLFSVAWIERNFEGEIRALVRDVITEDVPMFGLRNCTLSPHSLSH